MLKQYICITGLVNIKLRRMRPIDLRIVAETIFLVKRENEMTQKVHK